MIPRQPQQHKLVQAMMLTMDAPADKLRADDSRVSRTEMDDIASMTKDAMDKIQRS